MQHAEAIAAFEGVVLDQARTRAARVSAGMETARLAAVLLRQHGLGVAEAASKLLGGLQAADRLYQLVDQETQKLDSLWRENDRIRWEARGADLAIDSRIRSPYLNRIKKYQG